jgi:hypothetical protein
LTVNFILTDEASAKDMLNSELKSSDIAHENKQSACIFSIDVETGSVLRHTCCIHNKKKGK